MTRYLLNKSDLGSFLSRLSRAVDLWAPRTVEGVVGFHPFREEKEAALGKYARLSVKSFFLPRCEEMFRFFPGSEGLNAEPLHEKSPALVFGVQPCDARAMRLNARFFLEDEGNPHEDHFFREKTRNTMLVGWGCVRPGTACFCRGAGGDPFGEDGLDALVVDLGERLLLTVWNAETEALMAGDFLAPAGEEALAGAERVIRESREAFSDRPLSGDLKCESIASRDMNTLFALPVWRETASRCLNCGICTFLCPTCTCFDIVDRGEDGKAGQFRRWDSCMFGLFTQHASGHNPRPGKPERVRQRFMHKLRYFPERYGGRAGCVGCGRCVLHCPVNIDIREVAEAMAGTIGGGSR